MGILNPTALPLLSLLGVLVLIYLRERWRKRIAVPTLLLWREVKEDKVRARRFLPDLLFFAQALLLLFLIGGLLHPYLSLIVTETRGDRHIPLFEVSTSTGTRGGMTQPFMRALIPAQW